MNRDYSDVKTLCKEFFCTIDMPKFSDEKDSVWTAKVFNAFQKMGKKKGYNVWYKPNDYTNDKKLENSEYLVDLIWSKWEGEFCWDTKFKDGKACYWNELVLESEWGDKNNKKKNYRKIMYDFSKIIDLKARFKVMVFGYHNEEDKKKILKDFVKTIKKYKWILPEERYIFIAFPWRDENPYVEGYFLDMENNDPKCQKRVEIQK